MEIERIEGCNQKRRGRRGGVFFSCFPSLSLIFMHADVVDKWLMALGFVGAAGSGFTVAFVIIIFRNMMNNLGAGPSSTHFISNLNKNTLYFVYVAGLSFVLSFLEGFCWTMTGERQASRMRVRYLSAVMRQDAEYFDLHTASMADVITSVSSDSLIIQDVIGEKTPNLISNGAVFLGNYIIAFFMIWRLALVAFPTMLLLIIPGIIYGKFSIKLAREIREEYNVAGTIAAQAVSSIRTVYSFVTEESTITKFSVALDKSAKLGLRMGLIKGMAIGSNGITFAIWALLAWYGSHLVSHHGIKGGTVYSVGAAIISGGLALGSGLLNVKYFSEAISAGERIIEVIRRVPKIDLENTDGEVSENLAGDIEFRAVEFAYPSRPENPVLGGINLKVPKGRTVALVGDSGSGKSTIIALIERFYDPQAGVILLDGVDIKRFRLSWLRSQMGLVSQEPALFATSIKENILFGKEDATMEEVITATKASNAHNFISQLPQGYDTQVGESGVQVSGGQKQRIAIARAILKSPKILLLDEATSALDLESERVVQEALDSASIGRTTVIVAHRLSTIRNADLIVVMQSGQVVEIGSHNDLISREDGFYSSLVLLQQCDRATEDKSSALPAASLAEISQLGNNRIRQFSASSRSSSASSWKHKEGTDVLEVEGLPSPSVFRLLKVNAPEWKQAVLGSFGAVAMGVVLPTYAFVLGSMVSVFFLKDQDQINSKTKTLSLIFVALSIVCFLISTLQHYSFGAMGEYLTKRVREMMLCKILRFEVGWFDQEENSTGTVCSRLSNDANAVRMLVGDRLSLIIQIISTTITSCALTLVAAWKLAVVLIVLQPLIMLSYFARRIFLINTSKKMIQSQSESSKLAAEAVANLRTIMAFSSQDRILEMFDKTQEGPRRESIRYSWAAGFALGISTCLMRCCWSLSFWYGGRLIYHHAITAKAFFQNIFILINTGRIIAEAGSMTSDLARGTQAVNSVFVVLDRRTLIEPEDPEGHRPEKLVGHVEIIDVDFAYPARPDIFVFKGFTLNIAAGKSTALVGKSGCGKSTIIGLIERYYEPLKGTIQIDGKDIKSYHLRSLRKHIGLVSQEPTLFGGTIRDNITYGMEGATEGEIEEAAKMANAHDFISCLKDGYNTLCGDRGTQLSGGQKQRIAIARAILKEPTILLLDEATSALDNQSEKVVQEALERVMVGRTSVVVAHRLSTIQDCDQIAVLEKGVMVEKGTHTSLLAMGPTGSYYGLVRLQQSLLKHKAI